MREWGGGRVLMRFAEGVGGSAWVGRADGPGTAPIARCLEAQTRQVPPPDRRGCRMGMEAKEER
jgi:hypothetical protein